MELYWYEKLMVSGEFEALHKKMLKKINAGKQVSGIYLVMLSGRDDATLEIQPSQHMNYDYYKSEKGYVVGAAISNELATELAARIAATVYLSGSAGDFKDFFEKNFLKKPDTDGLVYVK